MSPLTETDEPREMRSEYDFSGAVRGKHHEAYDQGTVIRYAILREIAYWLVRADPNCAAQVNYPSRTQEP
jgi:hypothetical protein